MTLSSLAVSHDGVVTSLTASPASARRLAAFGLLPGTRVRVLRAGKHALVIELRGSFLAVSRELADSVGIDAGEGAV